MEESPRSPTEIGKALADAINKRSELFIELLSKINKYNDKKTNVTPLSFFESLKKEWHNGFAKPVLLWLIWLVIGTTFYAHSDFEGNYCKGFYYSVNVGYSIGWGVLHETNQVSYFFSTCYLLVGASTISGWLAYLIQTTMNAKDKWHKEVYRDHMLQLRMAQASYFDKIIFYIQQNTFKLYIITVWAFYILFGSIWSCYVIGWTPIEGVYFATSSLSTGGLHGIPYDSPDWVFFFVGLYSATGIPVMALAMGSVAASIVAANVYDEINDVINSKITRDEATVFDVLQIGDEKGFMDKHEYLLLTLVRLGNLDTGLMKKIFEHFDALDTDNRGLIPFSRLIDNEQIDESNNCTNPILINGNKTSEMSMETPKVIQMIPMTPEIKPQRTVQQYYSLQNDSDLIIYDNDFEIESEMNNNNEISRSQRAQSKANKFRTNSFSTPIV